MPIRNDVPARPRGGGWAATTKGRRRKNENEGGRSRRRSNGRKRVEGKRGRRGVLRLYRLYGAHLVFPPVVFISRTGETFRSVVREIPGEDFLRGS